MKFKKWLRDVGVAFENMWRELTTPRHITEDQAAAAMFCAKMRALGHDPAEVMDAAAHTMAAGLYPWQVTAIAEMFAKGEVTVHE